MNDDLDQRSINTIRGLSDREPALAHDSSTNALIRRYRGLKQN